MQCIKKNYININVGFLTDIIMAKNKNGKIAFVDIDDTLIIFDKKEGKHLFNKELIKQLKDYERVILFSQRSEYMYLSKLKSSDVLLIHELEAELVKHNINVDAVSLSMDVYGDAPGEFYNKHLREFEKNFSNLKKDQEKLNELASSGKDDLEYNKLLVSIMEKKCAIVELELKEIAKKKYSEEITDLLTRTNALKPQDKFSQLDLFLSQVFPRQKVEQFDQILDTIKDIDVKIDFFDDKKENLVEVLEEFPYGNINGMHVNFHQQNFTGEKLTNVEIAANIADSKYNLINKIEKDINSIYKIVGESELKFDTNYQNLTANNLNALRMDIFAIENFALKNTPLSEKNLVIYKDKINNFNKLKQELQEDNLRNAKGDIEPVKLEEKKISQPVKQVEPFINANSSISVNNDNESAENKKEKNYPNIFNEINKGFNQLKNNIDIDYRVGEVKHMLNSKNAELSSLMDDINRQCTDIKERINDILGPVKADISKGTIHSDTIKTALDEVAKDLVNIYKKVDNFLSKTSNDAQKSVENTSVFQDAAKKFHGLVNFVERLKDVCLNRINSADIKPEPENKENAKFSDVKEDLKALKSVVTEIKDFAVKNLNNLRPK